MKNTFRMTALALGVLSVFGSGQVMAADAVDGGAATATSLNSGAVTATTVGNGTGGTTINGGTVAITGATTINNTLTVDSNGGVANVNGTTGLVNVTNAGSASIGVASTGALATQSGSYTAYGNTVAGGTTGYVVGTSGPALVNGNAASQAVVAGQTYVNRIQGNTLIDGNLNINGTLNYSSNTSANTTVTGTSTVAGMSAVNAGQTGAVVDSYGKITTGGTTTQATAALTVTNAQGNTHGIVVQESQTTISGGTRSTAMTLNDNGVRFSNAQTGGAVTVTGVADGKQDFDAVNYRQLKSVAAGVSGVSAMANIPPVDQNKTFAIGVGLGSFQGQTALALGGSYRIAPNGVIRASVSTTNADTNNTVYGLGAGFSW